MRRIYINKSKWSSLAAFLLFCLFIELSGGWFTQSSVHTWYPTLKKASWNPPPFVFPIVWTVLYTFIAISGWLVFQLPASRLKAKALLVYAIQLFINFLWSFLFFGLQQPLAGLIDIILLIIALSINLVLFWQLSRAAAYLLVPYLLWVLYAFTLNLAIWLLN